MGGGTPCRGEDLQHIYLVPSGANLPAWGLGDSAPSDVHRCHTLPGTGLGAVSFHRVEAAGAIIATGYVECPLQHRHTS